MPANEIQIGIVGAGPRGLSVVERLCAVAGQWVGGQRITVHVIDPHVADGSSVWRTDQSRELLMNTVSSQVTMFADDSVDCTGPVVPGPSLYEWAGLVARLAALDPVPAWVREEARRLGPDSYPSRAFYGHYLQWVLRHLRRFAPGNVDIELHPLAATALSEAEDGRQLITLSDGTRLGGVDAVVLTQGHLSAVTTESETALAEFAERHRLDYVAPVNPANVDLDFIAPDQLVALRGMGLNFFDYMALLTVDRGGAFERGHDDRLGYLPSGKEPRMIIGSRRGVPYHARGENQKGPFGRHVPIFLTPQVIAAMRGRAERGDPVDFRTDVWPLIDREVRSVYYRTLIAQRVGDSEAAWFLHGFRAVCQRETVAPNRFDPFDSMESDAQTALLEWFGIGAGDRWDWHAVAEPYGERTFASAAEYQRWLLDYLENDVREARNGNVCSPLKAALDTMRDLRNEIRLIVDHGGLSGDSYHDDLQGWYTPFNAFVSIGPPTRRIEELIALIESGLVRVLGPGMMVAQPVDGRGFLISSSYVPGPAIPVTALIEARLPEPDIRRTTDPLVAGLLASGECVVHKIPIRGGGHYQTGGLAVARRPYNLLGTSRRPHPRRFAFGVPTETVHWVTAAGIRPGVNSVILADADAVALATIAAATCPE